LKDDGDVCGKRGEWRGRAGKVNADVGGTEGREIGEEVGGFEVDVVFTFDLRAEWGKIVEDNMYAISHCIAEFCFSHYFIAAKEVVAEGVEGFVTEAFVECHGGGEEG